MYPNIRIKFATLGYFALQFAPKRFAPAQVSVIKSALEVLHDRTNHPHTAFNLIDMIKIKVSALSDVVIRITNVKSYTVTNHLHFSQIITK